MKITMIGDSRVGKTTFMMSTYGLMRDGIQGFKVKCKDSQTDKKLYDAYQQFCKRGIYPDATYQMDHYQYDFYADGDFVMDFSLTDMRGEGIYDIDVEELQQEISESDAVIMFLNAYDIINGEDMEDTIDQLRIHLNSALRVDDQQKLLMVIFTQYDRVKQKQGTFEKLLDTVSDWKRIAEKNDKLIFRAVPTACKPTCMMNLDFVMTTLMLVGYHREVVVELERLNNEVEDIKKQFDGGMVDAIKYAFGFNSKRKKALERYQKLQNEEIPKYEKMEVKFNKLKKFYDDYEIGTTYRVKRKEDPFSF